MTEKAGSDRVKEGGFIICARFVPERVKLFSKVAGAGVLKTRHDLTAFIDVVLLKPSYLERT